MKQQAVELSTWGDLVGCSVPEAFFIYNGFLRVPGGLPFTEIQAAAKGVTVWAEPYTAGVPVVVAESALAVPVSAFVMDAGRVVNVFGCAWMRDAFGRWHFINPEAVEVHEYGHWTIPAYERVLALCDEATAQARRYVIDDVEREAFRL